jgi:SWIM zinc finger
MRATIVPIPARRGCYSVSTGGGTYECNASGRGTCSCPSYLYRHAEAGTPCKHLIALSEYLEAQRACPACHGYGVVGVRERYAGEAPPCIACNGTGLRNREAELKELFR